MTTPHDALLLTLTPRAKAERPPFELRVADDHGAHPVQVRPALVANWTLEQPLEAYARWLDQALLQVAPGVKRVRLYCTRASAGAVRLTVMGGSASALGRRQEPLIETLTWVRARVKRLRYHHDRPVAHILEHSRFFDAQGAEIHPPRFDPESASFIHDQEVTGALVVSYTPEFSLYEITYDNGASQASPELFREMRLAWLAGNIHDASVPPVRIIAVGPDDADQLAFARAYWPARADTPSGHQGKEPEPFSKEGNGYRYRPPAKPTCWDRCKQAVQPEGSLLSEREMNAIRDCVEAAQNPKFQYVEESRQVRMERIYAPGSTEIYIDVERTVEMVLKLKRADGNPCEQSTQNGCCPELTLRFAGSS
ncbi:MAG: hypothetical protein HQL97_11565 [Magnetococcales bacterium]|nr:hypothetical protein [Magnetococcales bacterium]